ncbi:MAG: nicotinate-nucleotide--dimethylbenzimidazole phosphoribosyltransferase [Bacteroidota bacterium]
MLTFHIPPVSREMAPTIERAINGKTKPLGALGDLEQLALQIGLVQQAMRPALLAPHLLVLAADHGIATAGVSAYPQAVTQQMVHNFLQGGAAINVFCKQNNLTLQIVDAGVNGDFEATKGLIHKKIAYGTRNFLTTKAMTSTQVQQAMAAGSDLVKAVSATPCNVIGFGEMGIGNTSAASMLTHYFTDIPLSDCIGRGTGLDDTQLQQKEQLLLKAKAFHALSSPTPLEILATFGGLEIAMMSGAMLQAAALQMLVLVDGFIATSAFLAAQALYPQLIDYAVFCHQSDEAGHAKVLHFLQKKPLLQLGMRLGEGTGCALAYSLLQSTVAFLNDMASFEEAGVSGSEGLRE